MSDIQVGEYVRTRNGHIGKIEKVDMGWFVIIDYDFVWKEDITKHSPNIIDLIEVGDYVNGVEITLIEGKTLCHDAYDVADTEMYHNEDIKSVVTKERFKESEYKVNE